MYAIAMAYLESAAVLYLRTIYGGVDPAGPRRPPFDPLPEFVWLEIGREAATMIMLAAVAWLGGRGLAGRLGAFALAMGIWEIFYYLFLRLFVGWPSSLLSPDVLFLIPLPWWGPVFSPVLIAAIMVAAGGTAMARERGDGLPRPDAAAVLLVLGGVCVCLMAFMLDALRALAGGIEAAYMVRGSEFPWLLYLAGLALAVLGVVRGLGAVGARPAVREA